MSQEKRERKYVSCYKGLIPLAEEIYNPELEPPYQFVWLEDAGSFTTKPFIEGITTDIHPIADENVRKGTVLLPSEATEHGAEEDLIVSVGGFIHRWVDVEAWFEELSIYYVLLTWLYDCFSVIPYLRVLGDPGSGKTRFIQTVGSICYKPIFCGGAITPAPIYRFIDMYHGTLIIDESDFKFSDSYQEIVKILNCGYMTGMPVLRCEGKSGKYTPESYDCYSPKIIANRHRFQDSALESRCFTYEMGQRKRGDIPLSLITDEFKEGALDIRNKLLLFRLRNYSNKRANNDLLIDGIEDRINQIAAPLLSIVKNKETRERIRDFIINYNRKMIADRGMTLEADILRVICELLEENITAPTVNDVTAKYISNYEQQTPEFKRITAKKVGGIIGSKLKLKKERGRDGYRLICDPEQMDVLKKKFGVVTSIPQDNVHTFTETAESFGREGI